MASFLLGANTAVFAAIALFFLRFWRQTRDPLFKLFAAAFAALSLNTLSVAIVDPSLESRHWFYLLRLAAYVLIIVAIVVKNRAGTQAAGDA